MVLIRTESRAVAVGLPSLLHTCSFSRLHSARFDRLPGTKFTTIYAATMHLSTLFVSLALALVVSADSLGAPKSMPKRQSPCRRTTPDVDPTVLCGKGYKECGDGWCCGYALLFFLKLASNHLF